MEPHPYTSFRLPQVALYVFIYIYIYMYMYSTPTHLLM
jgi:hypothetical protein